MIQLRLLSMGTKLRFWKRDRNVFKSLFSKGIMFYEEVKRVFLHIRWPVQIAMLLGFFAGSIVGDIHYSPEILRGFISWFLIWASVTLFNSYYDKDETSVIGLKHPPKVGKSLLYTAILFKLLGFLIALTLSRVYLVFYIIYIGLSVTYSHKFFRFKSNGYIALLYNFINGMYVFIIPSTLAVPVDYGAVILAGIGAGFYSVATYIFTQLHQTKEDTGRGDFSIASRYGIEKASIVSFLLMILSVPFVLYALYSRALTGLFYFMAFFFTFVILVYFYLIRKHLEKFKSFDLLNNFISYSNYLAIVVMIYFYIMMH